MARAATTAPRIRVSRVRLGVAMGHLLGGSVAGFTALAREADRLGYSVAWVAEAYGSDAPTVLSHLAAATERIDLGAGVMQIPARTPAMTAMTAATLDLLSGGRFRLGLGVSGPQVSEGWHGVRYAKPLARTREYVEVVRQALARETVRHDGAFYPLPLPDGPGKALKLTLRPIRDDLPVYLAATGPRNLELAGEIADGCLAVFASPRFSRELLSSVRAGRERAGRADRPFDVSATVPVAFGPDLERCADPIRGYAALYLGGMGSREQNFYNQLACRMGYADAAREVQDLYLAGRHRDAMAAVPWEFIDETSLIGPPERVVERLHAFAESGVTTVNVTSFAPDPEEQLATLRQAAEALASSGLGS